MKLGGQVASVSRSQAHAFSKDRERLITLLEGLGVDGDAHCGATVQHRSRVAVDPTQPNLRQVHLLQAELFAELAGHGFAIEPGDLGENVLTSGLDLLGLPVGTILRFTPSLADDDVDAMSGAVIELTGLRNPCRQINVFQPGLLGAVLGRGDDGALIRKAGVMAIVLSSGLVRVGDQVSVELPGLPHQSLEKV